MRHIRMRNRKWMLGTYIFVLFLFAIFAFDSALECKAAETVYSGTSGDLDWSIDSEGLLGKRTIASTF